MKGQGIFNRLFEDTPLPMPEEKKRQGRNPDLAAKSIEELMHRYVYYGVYTDKRNDAILVQLETERHISTRRILDILGDNYETLASIRRNPPTVQELRKKYPHLVW